MIGASHVPYRKHLRRLIPYYRPYRKEVLWGLALVVFSSAIWSVVPWLLRQALSAVDTRTEADILGALRSARDSRTAIIASHRVSALRDADNIVVLDGGRIVERGRHDELLARGGRYWSLLRRQQLVESIEESAPQHLAAPATDHTIVVA